MMFDEHKRLLQAFALLIGASSLGLCQQDAWHMDFIPTLAREAIDPIINGGSNFKAGYNFADLNASPCTTVELQADKSNYWMPQMYWITKPGDPNTTFISMNTNNRFYYFLGRNDDNTPVEPFPEGLRMVTGNPNAKAPSTPPYATFQCQRTASDLYYEPNFNFETPCNTGIKTELKFPSCWDGINLYKPDMSHMTFPSNPPNAGRCPQSHPVRLPMILLEFTWKVPAIGQNQNIEGHLAWANGDTTDVSALIGVDGPLVAAREDQYDASLAPIGKSWAKAGCYEDSQKFPTIAGTIPVYYDNKNLTVTQCTTFCGKSNKKVAAMMRRSGNWGIPPRSAEMFTTG
ncbi:hypothetical protein QFC24_004038 [Naganishia onofrii]|uniref:Uncharacterized protein n=1 Tax=Naganishia onofrii TaxID=1851511 RepID=A0ACC2XHY8_9TREE|nr:hypothetical protein QFC24_004038 [Naganishia onofrii]